MTNRLERWVAAHAPWLLAATAALTFLALAQIVDLGRGELRLQIDPSLDSYSADRAGETASAESTRRRFGESASILVALRSADVFSTESLARVNRLSLRLASLDGVESVTSLSTTAIPYLDGESLRYAKADREGLADPRLPEILRSAAAANPLVLGQLVSSDGRTAVLVVKPTPASEADMLRSELAERITRTSDEEGAPGVDVHVTGTPVLRSALSRSVLHQMRLTLPAIVIVITALLWLAFPTPYGVMLPLATIVVALVWTLATLSLFGRPLNLVTSLVPPLIVTMGLAYCAHVLTEFESVARESRYSPVERIAALLKEIAVPIAVTGFTTVVGFVALLPNSQGAMYDFAWLSALGTAYLVVLALTFVPALLRYAKPRVGPVPYEVALFDRGSEQLSRFDVKRRPQILALAATAFLVALYSASRIQVDDNFIGIFPEDSRLRGDYDAVRLAIGGVTPLDIAFDASGKDAFTDPSALAALDGLEEWLRAEPEVGSVVGLADHVRLLNRMLGGPGAAGIPQSRDAVKQMLFVGGSSALRDVLSGDGSSTLIRVRLRNDDTGAITRVLDRLHSRLASMPAGMVPHLSGSAVAMAESVQSATTGQLRSVLLSLALIYLCLSAQFLSFRIGLLALLPTVLQTALYFGALGLLEVPLNPTTALVECLVLGLAIDDTIHYLSRFSTAARRFGSESVAAASALKAVLRPVTLTKAILAIGFLTLVTGELRNQVLFGWLAALTLFCAWLVDAFVTPAFVSGLRIVTLWDTLRINLGENVQKSIPLFAGLTTRQARVFALMANLHAVGAGTRMISEGEASGSVYVVIDGELSVWVGDAAVPDELARLTRGAVVGEQGYFGQKRTANVTALTQARLLRFDRTDQERLCQSYPAIAARVFLSLNRLQAERQAERLRHDHMSAGETAVVA